MQIYAGFRQDDDLMDPRRINQWNEIYIQGTIQKRKRGRVRLAHVANAAAVDDQPVIPDVTHCLDDVEQGSILVIVSSIALILLGTFSHESDRSEIVC